MSDADLPLGESLPVKPERIAEAILAVLIPLVFLSIPVLLKGNPLVPFYADVFQATFGSASGWVSTLEKASPILLAGMGVLLAFRTGFWNIGAEGQMAMGVFAAAAIAFADPNLPAPLLIAAMFVVGAVAGGLYGAFAGWLKVAYGVNEILTTLMLNFVALLLLDYGAKNLWSSSLGFPFSRKVPGDLMLPEFFGLHVGIVITLLLLPVVGFLLYRTPLGFEFRAVGADPDAAHNSGMSVDRTTLFVIFLSGAFAGLAGAFELLGVVGRVQDGITGPNYGYIAIVATLLVNHRLRLLPVSALFLGGLLAANVALQVSISGGAELFIIGLVLLLVVTFNR